MVELITSDALLVFRMWSNGNPPLSSLRFFTEFKKAPRREDQVARREQGCALRRRRHNCGRGLSNWGNDLVVDVAEVVEFQKSSLLSGSGLL
jgi:hypothetical protein